MVQRRYIAIAVVGLALLWCFGGLFKKEEIAPTEQSTGLEIDYRSLGDEGPPPGPFRWSS